MRTQRHGWFGKKTSLAVVFGAILALATSTNAEYLHGSSTQGGADGSHETDVTSWALKPSLVETFSSHEVALGDAQIAPLVNVTRTSLVQNAAGASREAGADFVPAGAGSLQTQPSSAGASEFAQGTTVLKGVTISVTSAVIQGSKVIQVAAFRGGAAVAVFNLTTTTAEKTKLLQDLSALAANPEARFELTWEATSPISGKLKLKLESSYNAAASKPSLTFTFSFKHVVGTRESVDTVTATIPKEMLFQFKQLMDFKEWLAANAHPPLLKQGSSFQIIRMRLVSAEKQRFEAKGEEQALQWLHQLAARKEPILSVTGDLERNAVIEVPYFDDLTWPMLLKLRGVVDESAKGHTPVSSFTGTVPGLKTEKFAVPASWFGLSPEQQYELWLKGRQPGATGVTPGQLNTSRLFGPGYTAGVPPILFFDSTGQPFGANKQPDNLSLFGSRTTPVERVPDYVAGQFSPALVAKIVFPGGEAATHTISPLREWHKIEKRYPELRATLAPKEPEKQGALFSVTVNGKVYPLVAEFVERYPTLLHLLAHLATEDPSFVVNDITLNFGASVPRSVQSIFILETPEGVQPWCIFQYDIPITRRNTIVIKSLLKKARQAAESPRGCNIVNAKGLRFETITAVANVVQREPELKTANRQQLNFRGSSAECKRLGAIFTEAHKRGEPLALYFSATHLLRGNVEIPKFDKEGREKKPSIKTVTSRVKMNETFPGLLTDFQGPFLKYKVPTMEFPYVQQAGKPEASAVPHGYIPENWYHESPGKVKVIWHPQFPILGEQDTFTDESGPHKAGETVNIPLRPGTGALTGPFTVIQHWLKQHIPNLQLPVDLESMPAEDRNSLFKKIIIEVEGGEKIRLIDILTPLLRTPNWKTLNPAELQLPYHLLTLPIKNMFVEGNIEFIVTTPEGGQEAHTVPIRPGESWGQAADSFFHNYPRFDREKTTLSLFDSNGNPVAVRPDSPVYVGIKEAVQQRRKMRSSSVEEVQRFMEQTLRGADLVRPTKLRDLLAIIRKFIASTRPDVLTQLNLPDAATSQAEIARLKAQVESLRAKPDKTAEDYDSIQAIRRKIKMILAKETKWAVPSALTFFHVKEKGVEKDLTVPIRNPELRFSDEFWKLYHYATRHSPEAAMMDFANVYDVTFRVLGMEERQEERKRMKHKAKAEKKAEKEAAQVKVKVNVEFDVENEESSFDTGVDINLPSDFAAGLTIGGKRSVATQLSKKYNIPRSYFTFEGYPRVVMDTAKGGLPVLKVALQVVCSRSDGTIGVSPAELARVLTERGGYGERDLVFLLTTSGEKLRVPIENVRQIAPEKARLFMFGWKRTLADIRAEGEAKVKERAEAAAGEKALLFSVHVADPTNWRSLLGPWLSRMRSFGPLSDTKIQLIVRNEKEENPANRRSRCQVSTFGELLELINDMEKLVKICPGLLRAMTNRQPFEFQLGIKTPPPSGFRLWNRAHGDPERNRRYLERLAVAFANVHDDSKIDWKFGKHKGRMTPDNIRQIRVLLQSNKPRDAALVREILAVLGVPADDIARLTGRLNIRILHEREGVVTIDIARADGARITRNISAQGNPNAPVNIELPGGEYSLSYSLYSPTQQVSGRPCSIRTAQDFRALTWERALQWCNLKFQDLRGLASPFVWIEGSQTAMYPSSQPGTPIVSFQNDLPLGFTFRRPGSPLSGILPNDIYFNLVQQPGANVPGATFVQRVPTPSGNIGSDITYFGAEPGRWGRRVDPGTSMAPRGTTGEFNVYPDPDQEETGKAFVNPIHQTVEIPGFSRMPDLHDNFDLVFNLSKPPPPTGELVYVQAPAGNGRYFYCPGITLQEFLNLKNKEEAARRCGIPVELLEGDILVSSFSPGTTPNYAPARPAVPLILVDRLRQPHYYTALWEENPMKYIGSLLEGGHPEDQIVFTFANSDQCVLNRQMLSGLRSWVELARFCSVTFEGTRPTQIVGAVQVQIVMPESLKATFMKTHKGLDPQDIFSREPLAFVINNLLASQDPGVTLETTLVMADGSQFNFAQIPDEWRHLPAPQIPGLVRITIKIIAKPAGHHADVNAGTLGDLLAQLNIGGSAPFSQFVSKITEDVQSPTGMKIPSTDIRIGGPTPPGTPRPRFEFEMFNPETLGSDGYPLNFGTRVPVAHGAIPDTMPMENVIKMLHNPFITVHQKAKPQYKITAMAGAAVPFTSTAEHLDAPLSEVVRWLTSTLGIEDANSIFVTVVIDGAAYRAPLSAAQLLGHTVGSVMGLGGAVDQDDSHDLVFIGQPAPGIPAKKISPNQQMNFVVNGAVHDETPGSALDFAKLLNIQVPGKGQAPMDYKFSISGPGGETTQQLVPADLIRLLQEIAEMHGSPGLSLVLSFLNSLKQAMSSAPFKHPNAAINALLNTAAGSVPEGSYLVVFTGSGPTAKKVTVPITPLDKDKAIHHLLEHLNIALNSIVDVKVGSKEAGQIPVEDGSVDVGVLGKSVKLPLRFISSTDKSSIDDLLQRMGQRLGSMLQAAGVPHQPIVLRTVFTKRDGSTFTVETPLGTTESAQQILSSLTLWHLVPEEALHQHIKHVSMSVQVVGASQSAQGVGMSSTSSSAPGLMLPTQQTWGTLSGQPASSVPGFFIQGPGEKITSLADVGEQLVRVFFRRVVSTTGIWSRVFWGTKTAAGCEPKLEFPYYMVMGTKLASVPVPTGRDCMVTLQLGKQFTEAIPAIRPQDFEVEFLYHEPPMHVATAKGRKLLHSHSIEAIAVKQPIRELVEKAVGWDAVSSAQSCLITNPQVPFQCDDPLPVDPERDTLERIISSSRYVLITTKRPSAEQSAAFVQRSPFLARINRVQNLRQSSH
ncbi:hypothetical protein, conserved [Eimeria brunetti]|uniref:Rhoptry neck protein RON8 n=1 Tax=Eimeria brunetti TaxID=51314 RepID=U6LLA9_9EIME|nr:hypothetical protein, conserved [Eimeria brunetti]